MDPRVLMEPMVQLGLRDQLVLKDQEGLLVLQDR